MTNEIPEFKDNTCPYCGELPPTSRLGQFMVYQLHLLRHEIKKHKVIKK